MPIATTDLVSIACDNPACPGPPAALSASDRTGWIFATAEVYGEPVESHVFCSFACVAAAAADRAQAEHDAAGAET